MRANSLNNIGVSYGSTVNPCRGGGRYGGGGGSVSAFSTRVSSGTSEIVFIGYLLIGGATYFA